ncbi:hypothetical protein MKZ38_002181 [Zalerion maritima]|uniref:GH16 domain-containing protein n=1 Tax=Zalerion maritima TaxID=339359 RepID=A0AAD5WSP1_9PEZI|nr:hypothetical protein MKZ38_002181 [Zalerion maritima]
MLPIPTITAVGLAFATSVQAGHTYSVAEKYASSDFMDESKWTWRTAASFPPNGDPTDGYVNYVDLATAKDDLNIVGEEDGQFFMKVDTSQEKNTAPVSSVRIESVANWRHFLIVGKFAKFPKPSCSVWPAFWTNGIGEWPKAGEMNMYEAWNLDFFNRPALHTGRADEVGSLILNQEDMNGTLVREDCDNVTDGKYIGCVVQDDDVTYGSEEGGVYAVQFESDKIRMWRWKNGQAPVDLDDEHPDPDTWGTPVLATPSDQDLDNIFQKQQIILNIDICGGAPDATWAAPSYGEDACSTATGVDECAAYVAGAEGSIFDGAEFKVHGMTVWTSDGNDSGDDLTTSETPEESTSTTATPVPTSDEPETTKTPEPTTIEEPEETATAEPTAGEPSETTPSAETTTCDDDEPAPTTTASPVETSPDVCEGSTTSAKKTIYTTKTSTISSCEPTVTDCPAASETRSDTGGQGDESLCTSTLYMTSVEVVTSCEQVATACNIGDTTTKTYVSTTVFPTEMASEFPEEGTTADTDTESLTTTVEVTSEPATPTPTETEDGGVGGDEEQVTTVPSYDDSTAIMTAPSTTLTQMSSTISPGCLSGADCPTASPDPVLVSGAGKVVVAGWMMLSVGVLFL